MTAKRRKGDTGMEGTAQLLATLVEAAIVMSSETATDEVMNMDDADREVYMRGALMVMDKLGTVSKMLVVGDLPLSEKTMAKRIYKDLISEYEKARGKHLN